MSSFVLIHGTAQGPAGWKRLIDELGALGHRAFAPDLESGPVGQHEGGDVWRACVESVRPQLPPGLEDVIVVAHSGGGSVLSEIAMAVGARCQVWLAAIVPDAVGRRSLLEDVVQAGRVGVNEEWIGVDPTVDELAAAHFLFHDVSSLSALRWALSTLRRSPVIERACSVSPLADSRRQRVRSECIVPAEDRTLRGEWLAKIAEERLGVRPVRINGGHCPHVASPSLLAQQLVEVCQAR